MKTLTIKGMSERVHRWLKKRSALNHRSLNGEVLHILQGLADAEATGRRADVRGGAGAVAAPVYNDLDALAGTWTEAEATEFEKNTATFREIDEDMWE